MEIRRTLISDLDKVMIIYENARKFMRENGNPDQWGHNYPDEEVIKSDIAEGKSYVCVDNNEIVAVFYFDIGIDPTYINIYEGAWLNDDPYGVIHRIASALRKKGIASYCLDWCFRQCSNIRIDTHRKNLSMRNLLDKHGFTKCGIIYVKDGTERLAYQKVIKS